MKHLLLTVCVVTLFLMNSCALPLAMMGVVGFEANKQMTDIESFDYPEKEIYMAEEAIPEEKSSDIEILLPMGEVEGEYILYLGEPNPVEIQMNYRDGYEDLVVTASGGQLEALPEAGKYSLRVFRSGLRIEIIAKDTVTNATEAITAITKVMPVPIPAITINSPATITAEDFKKSNQVFLKTDHMPLPARCLCNGYKVTRVDASGQRETVENTRNGYTPETKALVAKAQKGDIYVFSEIKSLCPGMAEQTLAGFSYILE